MAQPPVNSAVANAATMYVNGLQLSWVSNTQVAVYAGAARNYTDTNQDASNTSFTSFNDIVLPVPAYTVDGAQNGPAVTINAAIQGAGGLDTGALANNTLYAVYVVGDSSNINPTTAMLSLSFDAPLLPGAVQGGYDMYRRIGAVLTDGAAHILPFAQSTALNSTLRKMWYDTGIEVVTAGVSAAYATFAVTSCVPYNFAQPSSAYGLDVLFQVQLTPTAAGDTVNLRPTGDASTEGLAIMSGDVAAVVHSDAIVCPCSYALGEVDYKVVGSVNLFVKGYIDSL